MVTRPSSLMLLLFACLALLPSCTEDPTEPPTPTPPPASATGIYVLNEGNFGDATGARLTLYDRTRDSVYLDLFESANGGAHLGSLGDDLLLLGDRLLTVMSGSEQIRVLSSSTHGLLQTLDLAGSTPHDIIATPDAARLYVTELFSDSVLSIDAATLTVRRRIGVGPNPQGMAIAAGHLFVCNSGFGSGSSVTVIRLSDEAVVRTLDVGYGPSGAAVASDGSVCVACTGDAFGTPPKEGSVAVLDPNTLSVKNSIPFTGQLWGRIASAPDGRVYVIGVTAGSFFGGPVHRIDVSTGQVTLNTLPGTFYAMAADASTGELALADAKSFAATGEVFLYSSTGSLLRRFPAQRGPGAIAFKHQ